MFYECFSPAPTVGRINVGSKDFEVAVPEKLYRAVAKDLAALAIFQDEGDKNIKVLVQAGAGHRLTLADPVAGVARLAGGAGHGREDATPGQRIAGVDRAQVAVLADLRRAG